MQIQALRQIRILVADDHPVFREGIRAIFAGEDEYILAGEAADGREAVEQFRLLRPDVTLIDLQMPVMSGIESIRFIRAEYPDARLIALTTYSGDAQVVRALQAGAARLRPSWPSTCWMRR
jgi:DNA-binding NarL/FixJ family response regulator